MQVEKRNGEVVEFDIDKIRRAIRNAFNDSPESTSPEDILDIADGVKRRCEGIIGLTVETIQDEVEEALMLKGFIQTAKKYIIYRDHRAHARKDRLVPDNSSIEDFVLASKYSRYSPEQHRREVFSEIVDRVEGMHLRRYPQSEKMIKWAFDQVREKRVLPSMRSMQFGGKGIEKNHARIYNCAYGICNRLEFFSQMLFLLLCGTGVGFSVEKEHVARLPKLKAPDEDNVIHWEIGDTIEGWSDALYALIESYVDGDRYIEFSYSKIRDKGSKLESSGGKAPGHLPLKRALDHIRGVLEKAKNRHLKPIECYDIVMYAADCVISGGVRRSATICLFSPDDEDMLNAKTGNWFTENPQRGRSNNSVKLIRSETTKEEFLSAFEKQKEWGEPGFYFAENSTYGSNPCVTGDTWVMTAEGPEQIKDLTGIPFTALVNGDCYSSTEKGAFFTGNKEVFKLRFKEGLSVESTDDHKFLTEDGWKLAADLKEGEKVVVHNHRLMEWFGKGRYNEGWLLGSLLGDGTFDDNSALLDYWGDSRHEMEKIAKELLNFAGLNPIGKITGQECVADSGKRRISSVELKKLAESYGITRRNKVITEALEKTSSEFYKGFLRGYFDADGSVQGTQEKGCSIRLTSVSQENLEAVQRMLLRLGIFSRIYFNRREEGYRLLPDGNGGKKEYYCKTIHELVIANEDILKFSGKINFYEPAKAEALSKIISGYKRTPNRTKFFATFESKTSCGIKPVYDCTIPGPHAFDANGLYAHNCVEIGLNPSDGVEATPENTGWQFCNLCEINGSMLKTEHDFAIAVQAATIIGTLQAGYTHFPYLGEITERLCEKEALLGVSITGMMDSPDVALNPEIQKRMAQLAVATNRRFAKEIGIESAARVTCVKPAGTTSLVLGTASGIHPRHARRYFRRVQANTQDPVYKFFKEKNPHMCEKSVWSNNGTDDVISFPIQAPDTAITRDEISALDLLRHVHSTQKNWVIPGNAKPWSSPGLQHNVSNTITVDEDEWDDVADFIWDHREDFTGISMLAKVGDKQYPQAPHEKVINDEDEVLWNRLIEHYSKLDYKDFREDEDTTDVKAEAACAGGKCDL